MFIEPQNENQQLTLFMHPNNMCNTPTTDVMINFFLKVQIAYNDFETGNNLSSLIFDKEYGRILKMLPQNEMMSFLK